MATTRLTRSYGSGVTGNRSKWTFSGWIKRSNQFGSEQGILTVYSNGSYYTSIDITSEDQINFFDLYNGGINGRVRANARNRDCTGWTHIVCTFDRNNATSGDKIRMWINGVRITGALASLETMPSNASTLNSDSQTLEIGSKNNASYFNGQMSHLHFCDGYAYEASDFGSFDSTTGEWKINTSPSVTYGTQGWFILKDGNSLTDQSGNSNNFTLGAGTLTKTEDSPNVFTVLNPLFGAGGQFATMSNGNTTSYVSNLGVAGTSTLGASSGKYYAEFKHSACTSGGADEGAIGVCDTYFINSNSSLGGSSSPGYQEYSLGNWGLRNTSGRIFYSSSGSKYTADNNHAGWSLGDIIMLGLDCDNNRLYFGKNGQWSSSNTWSSSTPSQYITIDPTNFEGNYHFACGDSSGTNVSTWQCNFGNGYFGTTAVSTAGTNASGNGIFEYDVPTGYTALSTKGLNL